MEKHRKSNYEQDARGITRLTLQYLEKIKVNKVREVVVPKEVIKG
jgi:hypothetical protein